MHTCGAEAIELVIYVDIGSVIDGDVSYSHDHELAILVRTGRRPAKDGALHADLPLIGRRCTLTSQ